MQQPPVVSKPTVLTPEQLAAQVWRLIATPAQWVARVRLDVEGRWYERIHMGDDYEWPPARARRAQLLRRLEMSQLVERRP